jgi:hypothetical protein
MTPVLRHQRRRRHIRSCITSRRCAKNRRTSGFCTRCLCRMFVSLIQATAEALTGATLLCLRPAAERRGAGGHRGRRGGGGDRGTADWSRRRGSQRAGPAGADGRGAQGYHGGHAGQAASPRSPHARRSPCPQERARAGAAARGSASDGPGPAEAAAGRDRPGILRAQHSAAPRWVVVLLVVGCLLSFLAWLGAPSLSGNHGL